MAIESITNPQTTERGGLIPRKPVDELAAIQALYGAVDKGTAAETVIRVLDPIIEQRLGLLLDKLAQCPPELGPMLDVRAQIGEVWRIRKELTSVSKAGKNALEALKSVVTLQAN